jgi:hypothetical protein
MTIEGKFPIYWQGSQTLALSLECEEKKKVQRL